MVEHQVRLGVCREALRLVGTDELKMVLEEERQSADIRNEAPDPPEDGQGYTGLSDDANDLVAIEHLVGAAEQGGLEVLADGTKRSALGVGYDELTMVVQDVFGLDTESFLGFVLACIDDDFLAKGQAFLVGKSDKLPLRFVWTGIIDAVLVGKRSDFLFDKVGLRHGDSIARP